MIVSHAAATTTFLKHFQNTTRQLHIICAHSKVNRDGSLMAHVPSLKRSMETVIYRMKSLLAEHKLLDAFWVGNLKNKTLDGTEVGRCGAVGRAADHCGPVRVRALCGAGAVPDRGGELAGGVIVVSPKRFWVFGCVRVNGVPTRRLPAPPDPPLRSRALPHTWA